MRVNVEDTNIMDQGNRVLIIAPLITLSNWVNEFLKWSITNSENLIGEVFNMAGLYLCYC